VQGTCATQLALRIGRHPQTVMGWVHAYNAQGPAGRPPFAPGSRPASARRCVRPRARQRLRP
jgi:transposase